MVARRTVLGASAGLLAATTVGAAAAADAATFGTPVAGAGRPVAPPAKFGARPGARTLAAWRTVERGRLRVPRASFPVSHLGITWRGTDARVRLRRSTGWTEWTAVGRCGGGPDGRAPGGGTALVVAREALGYEIVVGGSGVATITELNTLDAAAAVAVNGMPVPGRPMCPVPYLSRAAWGADESLRFPGGTELWPAEYRPVQTLTVHHTAGANDDPDPAATVRAIYHNQAVNQNWGDIGYHLLIDEAGRVYEGRWSGTDGAPVFGPAGSDGRSQMVVGGHVVGANAGNIGVSLLGLFTGRQPTAAARGSLISVLASLAMVGRLDARATVTYLNPDSGATRRIGAISGHRNWVATECPGDAFYPTLPTLRQAVAAKQYGFAPPKIPWQRSG
jgi:hypothetical protein